MISILDNLIIIMSVQVENAGTSLLVFRTIN